MNSGTPVVKVRNCAGEVRVAEFGIWGAGQETLGRWLVTKVVGRRQKMVVTLVSGRRWLAVNAKVFFKGPQRRFQLPSEFLCC